MSPWSAAMYTGPEDEPVRRQLPRMAARFPLARWGEVFPRWIPFLGGRGVPTKAAVIPATFGAVALTVLWTAAFVVDYFGVTLTGEPTPENFPTKAGGWETAIFYACYLPLLLRGPLLAAVTVAYARRRRNG